MKIGKFDFSEWTYNDKRMVSPLCLVRRLLIFPFVYVLPCITYLLFVLGFGTEFANDFWKGTWK